LVVLGGLILGLQYYINKGEKTAVPQPQPGPVDQVGVALPPAATGYLPPEAAYNTVAGSSNDLSVPTAQSTYQGACPGGSLAGIHAAHGKTWGYSVPKSNIAFDVKDNEPMYKFMGAYVECLAAARADISLCEAVPTTPTVSVTGKLNSPAFDCRTRTAKIMFDAYLLGKTTEFSVCEASRIFWDEATREKISLPDYCQAASKGAQSAREFVAKAEPEYPAEDANKVYPISKAECGGDPKCVFNFTIYSAIKSGNAAACPPAPAGTPCAAFITRSADSCESIVKDMSKTYCAAVERVQKRSGGFIGMSKDEMQARIAQVKLEKAAEELRKKEEEKTQQEINKKVKKLLGKE